MLLMLKEKCKGNLNEAEESILNNSLGDLQLNFVEVKNSEEKKVSEEKDSKKESEEDPDAKDEEIEKTKDKGKEENEDKKA
jgi:hypothetical protein